MRRWFSSIRGTQRRQDYNRPPSARLCADSIWLLSKKLLNDSRQQVVSSSVTEHHLSLSKKGIFMCSIKKLHVEFRVAAAHVSHL